MLPRWFQVFLALIAEAWSARQDAHLQFLRLQVELLRQKIPGNRVILSPEDWLRLLRAGAALGHAVNDVLEIVSVKSALDSGATGRQGAGAGRSAKANHGLAAPFDPAFGS